MDHLIEVLNKLNPADLTYDEWLRVGMALYHEGYPVEVWDLWSSTDTARYHASDCAKKWRTFGGHPSPVGGGSIIALAREHEVVKGTGSLTTFKENVKEPVPLTTLTRPLDWEDEIEFDGREARDAVTTNPQGGKAAAGSDTSDTKSGFTPLRLSPAEQLKTYFNTLFQPEDIVGYVTADVFQNREGRWLPAKGVYTRRAGEILRELDRHPEDVGAAVGDWNKKCGAWIRLNPLDGHGVKNENVAAYRYVLVESDEMPIDEQKRKFLELNLPIATLVTSGGKSLHAAVHIDAPDYETYRSRVQQLYDFLFVHGVQVDKANRNPSRLSRMPGVTRGGTMQELIAVNLGPQSWEEWIAQQAEQTAGENANQMPGLQDMAYYLQNIPELPEELIYGVLRQGHKMLISGSSKAGKSFLLLELCIALSEGREWLGFRCRKSKVLYINLEIDPASCVHRVLAIYQALGITPQHAEDFVIWNLRGKAQPLDRLAPLIIDRLNGGGFSAVVIDPIYKVITGDENNASDMAGFVNNFDRIAAETGCSVIYCHHHSKGAQGMKKAQDRASGSGVFARDPDAQLDMIQLELTDEMRNAYCDGSETAWRLEGSLREFANFKPVNFWFRYPMHEVDSDVLANAGAEGSYEAMRAKNRKCTSEDGRRESIITAYEACSIEMPVTVKNMAEYLGITERSVRDRIKETDGEFWVKGGIVGRNGTS